MLQKGSNSPTAALRHGLATVLSDDVALVYSAHSRVPLTDACGAFGKDYATHCPAGCVIVRFLCDESKLVMKAGPVYLADIARLTRQENQGVLHVRRSFSDPLHLCKALSINRQV